MWSVLAYENIVFASQLKQLYSLATCLIISYPVNAFVGLMCIRYKIF